MLFVCFLVVWVLPSAASQWLVAARALLLAQAVCSAFLVDRYSLQAGSMAGALRVLSVCVCVCVLWGTLKWDGCTASQGVFVATQGVLSVPTESGPLQPMQSRSWGLPLKQHAAAAVLVGAVALHTYTG